MVIFEVNLSSIFYLLINLKKTDLMNLGYIINFSDYIFSEDSGIEYYFKCECIILVMNILELYCNQ